MRAAAGYYNYKPEDIVVLTDDATNPRQRPTRQNMLDGMRWLVKDAHKHDSLFFHCALCSSLFMTIGIFIAYCQTRDMARKLKIAMAMRSTASMRSSFPLISASQVLS